MCKLQTTLLISALLATPLFAENASIHSVQNQANVDLLLPNLGISEYRHLVDYLASSYPKTLS
ncbi:MAG: hypothetical protein PSV35_03915, partial [bacterium]|nr:hypothetical protein [bacterium]